METEPPRRSDPAPNVALDGFHVPVRAWFAAKFETPTRHLQMGSRVIRRGAHTLPIVDQFRHGTDAMLRMNVCPQFRRDVPRQVRHICGCDDQARWSNAKTESLGRKDYVGVQRSRICGSLSRSTGLSPQPRCCLQMFGG